MATKSRANKDALAYLTRLGWTGAPAGQLYQHENLRLVTVRHLKTRRPAYYRDIFDAIPNDTPDKHYVLARVKASRTTYFWEMDLATVLGVSPNVTTLIATAKLLGEIPNG